MTNFIIDKPRIVFIHLPKTGGTSVRDALGKLEGRYFGHVPERFRDRPSLTVVREPKARFLSAFRMFKFGNQLEGTITPSRDGLICPSRKRSTCWKTRGLAMTVVIGTSLGTSNIISFPRPIRLTVCFMQTRFFGSKPSKRILGRFVRTSGSQQNCRDFARLGAGKNTRSGGGRRKKSASCACLRMTIAFWGMRPVALKPQKRYNFEPLRPKGRTVYDLWPAYFSDERSF